MIIKSRQIKFMLIGSCMLFIYLYLSLAVQCRNFNKTDKDAYTMINDTLPPEEFSMGAEIKSFRILTLADKLFGYRKPDYNGGFFFGLQVASATKSEYNRKVEFDKIKKISNYIVYCREIISERSGTWSIPSYDMRYIEIEPPFDIRTFDLDSYTGEWLLYKKAESYSSVPQDLLVLSRLYTHSSKNRDTKAEHAGWTAYEDKIKQSETIDFSIINKLKSSGLYDTIIKTDNSIMYINTDLEIYEQSLANDVFFISYRKFHTNGRIKEQSFFLPGVYVSRALPVGLSTYYNEEGSLIGGQNEDMEHQFILPGVNVNFLLKFLEREGYIDTKSGKGKAIMTINTNVDPHARNNGNSERLSIHSNWQITADSDQQSSVGVLIKHEDDTETVYLLDKPTRTVLKKFKR